MIASIVSALFLLGYINAVMASNFLFVTGVLLIAGEIGFGTFWLIGFNGLLALYVGYAILTGDQNLLGLPIDWATVFGISFVEFLLLLGSVFVIAKYRNKKATTGTESMIGRKASIVEWSGKSGQVSIHGELWKAKSEHPMDIAAGEEVTITAVDGLLLKVKI